MKLRREPHNGAPFLIIFFFSNDTKNVPRFLVGTFFLILPLGNILFPL
jgi:hypothetical protein